MKTITEYTKCNLCEKTVVHGKMAQTKTGFVCEECVREMIANDLVMIDAPFTKNPEKDADREMIGDGANFIDDVGNK